MISSDSLIRSGVLIPDEGLRWSLIAFAVTLLAVVWAIVGPPYAVGVMGLLCFPYVYSRPERALLFAPAYMILALAIAPQQLRLIGEGTPPEYYYYAVGLFFIALPLGLKLPWRKLFTGLKNRDSNRVPLPLLGVFLVAIAAGIQGLRLAFGLKYVVAQFFGVLLFFMFFWAAQQFTHESRQISEIISRIKWVAVISCVYITLFYLDVRDDIGIFKRNTSVYAAILASYVLGELVCSRRKRVRFILGVQFLILIGNAILFRSRGAVGIFFIVAVLTVGLLLPSRKVKLISLTAALAVLILGIEFNLFAPLADMMPKVGGAAELIPDDVLYDPSFIGRTAQVFASINVVREHPFLGLGLGSIMPFFHPGLGMVQEEPLVDQGLAYLLSKFGLLGLAAYGLLLAAIIHRSGWPSRNPVHFGLFLAFVFQLLFLLDTPIIFHFIFTPWVGMSFGFLYHLKHLSRDYPSGQHVLLPAESYQR